MRTGFRLLIALLALALLPSGAMAARSALRPDDMTLGNPKARVVVVEYASLACPHCAQFHKAVFPTFRKKYIDTGRVLFVYREYLTAPGQVAVPATVLSRCVPKKDYFTFLERAFAAQESIYKEGTVAGLQRILKGIAAGFGVNEAAYDACLADQTRLNALDARMKLAVETDGVDGTPTFFVNGVKVQQPAGRDIDLPLLDAAIAKAK